MTPQEAEYDSDITVDEPASPLNISLNEDVPSSDEAADHDGQQVPELGAVDQAEGNGNKCTSLQQNL